MTEPTTSANTLPLCNVGYVTHTYPSISHTFVLREVQGLRRLGGRVVTFSIHRPSPDELLSEADREESSQTLSILPISWLTLLRVHLAAVGSSPRAYLSTVLHSLQQGGSDPRRWLRQLFYFAEAIILWSHARRAGVRHLHAHLANVAADVCWLATRFANGSGRDGRWQWSFTMHGPTEFFEVSRFNLRGKVAAADLVICISDFCRSQLMMLSSAQHWPKLRVVHCGVDLDEYRFRLPAVRSANDPVSILSVGRLVPDKGQALLIEALSQLRTNGVDARLTLVGGGPDRGRLEQLSHLIGVADHVSFTGPRGQGDLPALFAEHDIFCLPSFAEGIPVVFMEAMAIGVTVVATRVAGIPELIDEGKTGFLVPPGRPDRIADAIADIASSRTDVRQLSTQAREVVTASFDATRCAADLARLFSVLEHGETDGDGLRYPKRP
jgi:glycosyltransferase involved in cell wall biosynthesis